MASRNVAIGLMLLSQVAVGTLGNFSLLYHHLVLSCSESTLRSTDVILKHLMIANLLVILAGGIPQTMTAFGLKYFLSDIGCELIFYIQRVGRSLSIIIICLLSIFQNISISPMNSHWKDLKGRIPKYIGFSISFCWILYIVLNSIFPLYVFDKMSSENTTNKRDFGYCSYIGGNKIADSLYAALIAFPEVVFSVLIIWSSGSMVLILYRHKQQVQHIRSLKKFPRCYPESRATRRILALVCTFVTFHTLSSLLNLYIALFSNSVVWIMNTNYLISLCFSTVSPFLLMSHESTEIHSIQDFICLHKKKKNPAG
ncbi:vomeronasal type-1 receptor 4-like [Sciurus carolinensis]|uniref:vomeronasal type-1 receptor 4-like n=1 Tax=Sciurus carolinensis TaxID=30640 RepID=UPI001FB32229|nr:vomeronasal type-1 receptor 4-like [Sciurus carolinensis]